MLSFMVRRSLLAIVTLWAVSVLSFVIVQLPPGDYVTAYIAELQSQGTVVTASEAAGIRAEYGLGQPLPIRYVKWMDQMIRGNFGVSFEYSRPVRSLIGERLALTMALTLAAVIFTWLIAFPIGIYSAVRQYSAGDYFFTFIGFLGFAIPNFLLALIVMYLSFEYFNVQPGGLFSQQYQHAPWDFGKVVDLLNHLWVPAIILGAAGAAKLIRIMRANLLDELSRPYVLTARSKGLPTWRLILKYPVRLALNPFVSTVGYTFPLLVAGSIIVSIVLNLPTIGPMLLEALIAQDVFLAGTIILMIGAMTIIGTLLSDILLAWVDPRIRMGS